MPSPDSLTSRLPSDSLHVTQRYSYISTRGKTSRSRSLTGRKTLQRGQYNSEALSVSNCLAIANGNDSLNTARSSMPLRKDSCPPLLPLLSPCPLSTLARVRVCIDIQSAVAQRAGVGRYTAQLAQHLPACSTDDDVRLFYFDFKHRGAPFIGTSAEHTVVRWCPGRVAQLAWRTLRWPNFDVLAGPADVYHFPNFILPPLGRGRAVVTIHDMSFMRYPDFAEDRNRRHLTARIQDTVTRADAIITVSQFSADEVCRLLPVDRARVFPVHLGISESLFAPPPDPSIVETLARLGVKRPYLLTVGTLEPRKNIPFLIELFEKLDTFKGQLVVAGARGWKCDPILARMACSSRATDIQWLGHVGDEQLPALYAGAEAFLFASHYEGFGLPPLEAMACGTPVLSSQGGSLAEVLGDGALLIDSFEPDIWLARLRELLSDPQSREKWIEAGRRRAATYSWTETARKTWDVYRHAADG